GGQADTHPRAPTPHAEAGDSRGAGRASVGGAPPSPADPRAPTGRNETQPGLGRSVPETREVGIAAPPRGERQLPTPAGGEQTRRREERSGDEPLETPATAFEPEIGATSCDGAAGPFPGEGRRERRGAGPKEAIVAYRRDAHVDSPGGLGGGGASG